MNEKRFKRIFVTEPGKDFSMLVGECTELVFVCNGFEFGSGRDENIRKAINSFDPKTDAWVPVGRMLSVAKTALELARRWPKDTFTIGVFKDGEYTWEQL